MKLPGKRAAFAAIVFVLAAPAAIFAQGTMGGGYGNGNGYGNGGMMGGGNGYGGYGMMGGGPGLMGNGWGPQANTPQGLGIQRISMKDAQGDVEAYLKSFDNPNLVIGEVMEFDRNFYALVKEKDTGRGAFELLVDPYTGNVGPEPGPNMMWNAKYGPMSRGFRSTSAMTVTVEQARADAQKYLDGVGPGFTVEEHPDVFYGYYTAHVLKDGKILGMLGINGYNGQVWFHSWHGVYRTMETMEN